MKNAKKIKYILCVVFAVILIISFVGFLIFLFSDDDFAPYSYKTKKISVPISGNVFVPSEIEEQLNSIVSEYEKGLVLTEVEYTFKDNLDTQAFFQFTKRKGNTLMGWNVKIYVDCSTETVYLVEYAYGNSKRLSIGKTVEEYNSPIIQKDKNAYDVYQSYIKADEAKAESADHIVVEYYCGTVMVVLYDKNNDFINSLEL